MIQSIFLILSQQLFHSFFMLLSECTNSIRTFNTYLLYCFIYCLCYISLTIIQSEHIILIMIYVSFFSYVTNQYIKFNLAKYDTFLLHCFICPECYYSLLLIQLIILILYPGICFIRCVCYLLRYVIQSNILILFTPDISLYPPVTNLSN